MTADVGFYVELARDADGPVVELAVGNGRVAVPVAKAIGRPVIGIDTSAAMLEQARIRAAEAGVELELREGDMRDLAIDQPAALIYCPFRALLHLPTWADRRRTFERVAASLRPGGLFAWNAFAFDHQIAVRLDGERQSEPVPHLIRYAVGANRIDIILEDGATSSVWWATKNEWLGLLDVAGLSLEGLYGGDGHALIGDRVQPRSRRGLFQRQAEQVRGVEPVHGGPAVGPVADVAGDARVAGDADQGRHEAVISFAVHRRGEPHNGRADAAGSEGERHLRILHPCLRTAGQMRRSAVTMPVPFGPNAPRCEPERPGGDEERSVRIHKRLAECLDGAAIH